MKPTSQHPLLDALISEMQLKNDAGVATFLNLAPPHVSRLRHRKLLINGDIILRIYDKTGWSIEKIRSYLKGPE